MVRKADGSWRPCGDFRRLNLVTEPDVYPLPNMLDFAAKATGCTVFSKIDLRKGYPQIPVNPADVQKTAITTPFGLFKYKRMPFGLRNAGPSFQRHVDRAIRDRQAAFAWVDDIVICSRNHEEHVIHVGQVLQALQDNGLVMHAEKCEWGVPGAGVPGPQDFGGWRAAATLTRGPHPGFSSPHHHQGAAGLLGHGEFLQAVPAQHCPHAAAADRRLARRQEGGHIAGAANVVADTLSRPPGHAAAERPPSAATCVKVPSRSQVVALQGGKLNSSPPSLPGVAGQLSKHAAGD
jgi:hypothetical protein